MGLCCLPVAHELCGADFKYGVTSYRVPATEAPDKSSSDPGALLLDNPFQDTVCVFHL